MPKLLTSAATLLAALCPFCFNNYRVGLKTFWRVNVQYMFNEHCYFYWTIQRAVYFVDYVEDQESFVGAKKLTDFYSVIFILFFWLFFNHEQHYHL